MTDVKEQARELEESTETMIVGKEHICAQNTKEVNGGEKKYREIKK